MPLLMKCRRLCKCRAKRYPMKWLHQVLLILAVFGVVQFLLYQTKKKYIKSNSENEQQISLATSHPRISNDTSLSNASKESNISLKISNQSIHTVNLKEIFDAGKWNSSFVSRHHTHYAVNCAAIVRGERTAIDRAARILKEARRRIPDDIAVKQWTMDCDRYRNGRRYPTAPLSQEEAEYPIAYILVTHADSSQLERLLRVVYQPQNVYCIHPDAKSPSPFQDAIRSLAACFPNVFITSKPVKVNYAHSSRLQADVNCMSDLLQRPEPWNYVLNLCAQDFPLKTNLEIIQQLKAFQGHNDIPGITAPDWFTHRTHVHHEFRNGIMVKLKAVPKAPPPQELKFFFGNAYYAATKGFVQYVIHNQTAIDLLKYSEDTYSPDEHYWVTLNRVPGVPGGCTKSSWNSTVRFVHWKDTFKTPECVGRYVRNICVFGAGYVQYLAKDFHLFANKFHMSFDPVAMQCMEEVLDYRSSRPESVSEFIPNFPARHLFGL